MLFTLGTYASTGNEEASGIVALIGIVIGIAVLVCFFILCHDVNEIKRHTKRIIEILPTPEDEKKTIIKNN
jgi:hypothetical protein